MQTEYEIFQFDNFIEKAALALKKPVVFIRSYGWNHSQNIEKINESMDIYRDLLPLDMFESMRMSEFIFLTLDNIEEAMLFFDETFPKSQADCDPELYVFYSIINELGQTILTNE